MKGKKKQQAKKKESYDRSETVNPPQPTGHQDIEGRSKRLPLILMARTGPLPLSCAQQRLWLLHQLQPDSPAYNMRLALQLEGRLDVGALERAVKSGSPACLNVKVDPDAPYPEPRG